MWRETAESCHVTLMRDDRGEPKSALWINIDVTTQKDIEARLLRAQRMESIGALASGVAHDLNNILSPIMLSVPIFRAAKDDEQREELISAIEMCAQKGADIVKQVLTFGQGVEGEKRRVQPGVLIDEMVKIARRTFPQSITVQNDTAPGLWSLLGNATQLHQVLLNLCVNARDAMASGGVLEIKARWPAPES